MNNVDVQGTISSSAVSSPLICNYYNNKNLVTVEDDIINKSQLLVTLFQANRSKYYFKKQSSFLDTMEKFIRLEGFCCQRIKYIWFHSHLCARKLKGGTNPESCLLRVIYSCRCFLNLLNKSIYTTRCELSMLDNRQLTKKICNNVGKQCIRNVTLGM